MLRFKLLLIIIALLSILFTSHIYAAPSCESIKVSDGLISFQNCIETDFLWEVLVFLPDNETTFYEINFNTDGDATWVFPAGLEPGNYNYQIVAGRAEGFGGILISSGSFVVTEKEPLNTCNDGEEGIETALGCVSMENLTRFTRSILIMMYSLIGGAGLLMISYSAYMVMSSKGDPRKLQASRELLIGTIGGLLLAMSAAFILRFFGGDVLGLF